MAFKNKISTKCRDCSIFLLPGNGMTDGPPWVTRCDSCYEKFPKIMGKVLLSEKNNMICIKSNTFLGKNKFDIFKACIDGAKFNFEEKLNLTTIDKVSSIIERLHSSGFSVELEPSVVAKLQAYNSKKEQDIEEAKYRIEIVDDALEKRGLSLFPFQKKGVLWLASRSGALLSDQMGLGKTIQAIIAVPYPSPVIIVCPSVAKGIWLNEINKWRPEIKTTVFNGRNSFRPPKSGEAVILNYDILPDLEEIHEFVDEEELETQESLPLWMLKEFLQNTVLIADEAHALKSSRSQRSIKFKHIAKAVKERNGKVWLITATPILNYPPDIWNIMQCAGIAQEAFGTWKNFNFLFSGEEAQYGGTIWGKPKDEASERIKRVCLRRMRSEVLPQLPEKTWREVFVDIGSEIRKQCDSLLDSLESKNIDLESAIFLVDSTKSKTPEFETFSKVRQSLAVSKIPSMIEIIEEFEEQEEPLIVFSAHRAPIDVLEERDGWAVITGDTKDRKKIEEDFQSGKLKGIGATIAAGGVALTLTKSSNVLFVDLSFTPALNDQAEDRVVRIGQTRGVVITTLVADHALDRRVNSLLRKKKSIINNSVEKSKVGA